MVALGLLDLHLGNRRTLISGVPEFGHSSLAIGQTQERLGCAFETPAAGRFDNLWQSRNRLKVVPVAPGHATYLIGSAMVYTDAEKRMYFIPQEALKWFFEVPIEQRH